MSICYVNQNAYLQEHEIDDAVDGSKRYAVHRDADGVITLTPRENLGQRELYLLEDPELLASVNRGITDIQDGRFTKRTF